MDYCTTSAAITGALAEIAMGPSLVDRKSKARRLAEVLHSVTFAQYTCIATIKKDDKEEEIDVNQTIAVSRFAPLEEQVRSHATLCFGAIKIKDLVFTSLP